MKSRTSEFKIEVQNAVKSTENVILNDFTSSYMTVGHSIWLYVILHDCMSSYRIIRHPIG